MKVANNEIKFHGIYFIEPEVDQHIQHWFIDGMDPLFYFHDFEVRGLECSLESKMVSVLSIDPRIESEYTRSNLILRLFYIQSPDNFATLVLYPNMATVDPNLPVMLEMNGDHFFVIFNTYSEVGQG